MTRSEIARQILAIMSAFFPTEVTGTTEITSLKRGNFFWAKPLFDGMGAFYNISIGNDEREKIETVGQLIDCVSQKLDVA